MPLTAPVLVFGYSRPRHLRRCLQALLDNPDSEACQIRIVLDLPPDSSLSASNQACVEVAQEFCQRENVSLLHRDKHFGLAQSIISAVDETLEKSETVIVIEDDLVVSPTFLSFMNEALLRYADDDRVISVNGYVPPLAECPPEAFFLRVSDCWGWATWRRGWALLERNGQKLFDDLQKNRLLGVFDFGGAYPHSQILRRTISGELDSWAILWAGSSLLSGKLSLYPGGSLVKNTGFDGSGTHSGKHEFFETNLVTAKGNPVFPSRIEASDFGWRQYREFFIRKRLRATLNSPSITKLITFALWLVRVVFGGVAHTYVYRRAFFSLKSRRQ